MTLPIPGQQEGENESSSKQGAMSSRSTAIAEDTSPSTLPQSSGRALPQSSGDKNPLFVKRSGQASRPGTLRAAPDALYAELTDEERYVLASSLGRSLEQWIKGGKAIYLDGLGILFPVLHNSHRSYAINRNLAIRREGVTSVDFEKCGELLTLHRERFGAIMEAREIASRLYPALPLLLQLRWSPEDLKLCILGLIRAVRSEIVTNGFSRRLDKLGTFYALHNRHGNSIDDWFAGADIFLSSPLRWVQEVETAAIYERPLLSSAWEIFAAAFENDVGTFAVDVEGELGKIPGFLVPQLPAELRTLTLKVFKISTEAKNGISTYLYCTNGVRRVAIGTDSKNAPRCELTFKIAVDSSNGEIPSDEELQRWPRRAFALAAAVIAQQLLGKDSAWVGMSVPLVENPVTKLDGVVLQRFDAIPVEQLSEEGEFSYVNILGITNDELLLADAMGLGHLLALLRRKGLDATTKLRRTSVIARTTVTSGAVPPTRFSPQSSNGVEAPLQ